MNQLKNVLRTLLFANLIGVVVVTAVLVTDLSGQLAMTTAVSLLLFSLMAATVITAFCTLLSYLFNRRELILLSVLLSLSLAAANVLSGDFANDSLLPLAIYAVALANGLFVSLVVTAVSPRLVN